MPNRDATKHAHDEPDQTERNWDAFKKEEGSLIAEHLGRTVLLHDGQIDGIYNDSGDAYSIGCDKFGLGNFSIQTVGERPKSLGIFTSLIGR